MLKTSIEYNSKRFIELTLKKMEKQNKSMNGQTQGHLATNCEKKIELKITDIDNLFLDMLKKDRKDLFKISIAKRKNKKEGTSSEKIFFPNHHINHT